MIAKTFISVQKVSFQAATRFSTGVSKYHSAMMAALTVTRSGGMAAEIREKASKSSVTNTGTTAMNRPTLLLLQLEPLPWSTSSFTGVPQGTSIAASTQAEPKLLSSKGQRYAVPETDPAGRGSLEPTGGLSPKVQCRRR